MTSRYDRLVFNPPIPATVMGWGSAKLTGASASTVILTPSGPTKLKPGEVTVVVSINADERFEFSAAITPAPHDSRQPDAWVASPAASDADVFNRLLARLRKGQHIALCRDEDVESSDRHSGFAAFSLLPKALPDLDWNDIDTRRPFLGRTFASPFMIPGMTGGLRQGAEINLRLARAAAAFDIPMGVGSQRVALDHPEYAGIFGIKRHVPNVFLIGNIGIAQLASPSLDSAEDMCRRAIDMIGADAFAIHVNVLQELLQVEGDRRFRGLDRVIAHLAKKLPVPVIVKEVGAGLDPDTAKRLLDSGVAAIDVGGRGGTSWGYIESLRSSSPVIKDIGRAFRDFGIPTAHAVVALREACPDAPIIATGGVRDGLDAAKAIALGATMVGVGLPLFRAALDSEDATRDRLGSLVDGLRTAMMCSGVGSLDALSSRITLGQPGELLIRRRYDRQLGI